MEKIVKKAVFPVAGLGTRFLPATKANPKEMLTVVDKPLIQYAAEEAVNAGIEELIFVTSSSKRAIEDHFDKNYELESELEKNDLLWLCTSCYQCEDRCPEGVPLTTLLIRLKNMAVGKPAAHFIHHGGGSRFSGS